jgi:hypothetical protein
MHVTDDVDDAVAHILTFYRNYHSVRFVGDLLVIRLRAEPTEDELAELSDRFADICVEGGIDTTEPLPPEAADHDHLDLPRVVLQFDRSHLARLRQLIDALNQLPSAPQESSAPPEAGTTESAAGLA